MSLKVQAWLSSHEQNFLPGMEFYWFENQSPGARLAVGRLEIYVAESHMRLNFGTNNEAGFKEIFCCFHPPMVMRMTTMAVPKDESVLDAFSMLSIFWLSTLELELNDPVSSFASWWTEAESTVDPVSFNGGFQEAVDDGVVVPANGMKRLPAL
jgi:hypothetical protein